MYIYIYIYISIKKIVVPVRTSVSNAKLGQIGRHNSSETVRDIDLKPKRDCKGRQTRGSRDSKKKLSKLKIKGLEGD